MNLPERLGTLFLFLILSILPDLAFSQKTPGSQIIPPAPNAANIAQFVATPMTLYTGTPQINIPIYTIKVGNFELPISMNYNAGGIKVADMASWTGLGWSLSAGGVITRSVVGRPDETPLFGYLNSTIPPPLTEANRNQWNEYASGIRDGEPDIFYYNLPGYSGRYVFHKDGNIHLIPKQNFKVTVKEILNVSFAEDNGGSADCIVKWEIVDDKGIIYRFNDYEKNVSTSRDQNVSGTTAGPLSINSWYLTEIELPSGQKIIFSYNVIPYAYDLPPSKTSYAAVPVLGTPEQGDVFTPTSIVQRQYLRTRRLSSIEFPNGKVRFIPNATGRADLIGDNALDKVIIENDQAEILRQFKLTYQYMIGNSLIDYNAVTFSGEQNFFISNTIAPPSFNRRLILKNITEQDGSGVAINAGTSFDYHTDFGLPNRASVYTDYWGHANNLDNSGAPAPAHELFTVGGNTEYYITGKSVDFKYARQGTLYKITYPTGGWSSYEYESNETAPGPSVPPTITKSENSFSLSLAHYKYNVDGWYEGYDHEIRPDGNGNSVRQYYIEFEIKSTQNSDLQIVLENVPNLPAGGLKFYIEKVSNHSLIWQGNVNGTFPVTLYPGVYRLYHCPSYALLNSPTNPAFTQLHSAGISGIYEFTTSNPAPGQQIKAGGIRVKKSSMFDPVSAKTISNNYTYILDGTSSGTLVSSPYYKYRIAAHRQYTSPGGGGSVDWDETYDVLTYNSWYPLSTTHGSYVGYSFVEKQQTAEDGSVLGKTEYSYSSPLLKPNITYYGYYVYPNPPVDNRDWLRGNLLQEYTYSFRNGSYIPVKKMTSIFTENLESIGTNIAVQTNIYNKNFVVPGIDVLDPVKYNYFTGSIYPSATDETLYEDGGSITTTTTTDFSLKSLLPIKKTFLRSNGETTAEHYTYPKEYPAGNAFINNLVQKNIVSVPIETVKTKVSGGQTFITGGNITQYYSTGGGLIELTKNAELAHPLALSSFKFSNAPAGQLPTSGNVSAFSTDPTYVNSFLFTAYDSKLNIGELQKANDVKEVYLWGYKGQYPVAKIVGSDYATVTSVVTQAQIDAATSIANNDANVRLLLNTLRTHANTNNALISTYTYKPLVGMTSTTDPSGKIAFYDYDSFGRLKFIKDQDGKVLKVFEYKYQVVGQ